MRFMLTFSIPVEAGNAAIREGQIGRHLQAVMERLKPEAAYFGPTDGRRGGHLVIDIDDAAQIPALSESLFMGLNATVDLTPVMTWEDLQRGLAQLQQAG